MNRSLIRAALALALAVLVGLAGATSATAAGDPKPSDTLLLVARPALPDPNFAGSVVLVSNSLGPAPIGIIVNRPTRIPVARLFPDLPALAQLEDRIYYGGPVATTSVTFLVRADTPPARATRIQEGLYLSADRRLLRSLLARDTPMAGLRIFAGYSGWSPGQLEAEIARGDWKSEPADTASIFDGWSERPWPDPPPPRNGQRT